MLRNRYTRRHITESALITQRHISACILGTYGTNVAEPPGSNCAAADRSIPEQKKKTQREEFALFFLGKVTLRRFGENSEYIPGHGGLNGAAEIKQWLNWGERAKEA